MYLKMNKYEAKQALNDGLRITHRFFTPEEYLHRSPSNGQLLDEKELHLNETMFWYGRSGGQWEEGWEIYCEKEA